MSNEAAPVVPPSSTYFAPLVGLRAGRRWVGLLGLELQPALGPGHQKPRWKMVAWNAALPAPAAAGVTTIQGLFDDSFSPLDDKDHLRYVGRWIPTSGVNPATNIDYGASYQAAQHAALLDFDQAVLLRRSDHDDSHKAEWIEGAFLFTNDASATLAADGLSASVTGGVFFPLGLPATDTDSLTSAVATLTLATFPKPQPDGSEFRYAALTWQAAGVSYWNDWNGYSSTGAYSGVGWMICNSELCAPATPVPVGVDGHPLSAHPIRWSQIPSQALLDYVVTLSRHTRDIRPTTDGVCEVVQRSHGLIDSVSSDSPSAVDHVSWVPADFAEWFVTPVRSSQWHFYVQATFTDDLAALMNAHAGDLAADPNHPIHDGSLGDSVSFAPHVDRIQPSSGKNYVFSCTVSNLANGEPQTEWGLATATGTSRFQTGFPRFGSYDAQACGRSYLAALCDAAVLPFFMGWDGLDLQWHIVRTVSSPFSVFSRSEGSLTLVFQQAATFPPSTVVPPGSGLAANANASASAIPVQRNYGTIRSGRRRLRGCENQTATNPFLQVRAFQILVASVNPYTRDLLPEDLLSSIDEDEISDFVESPILIQLEKIPEENPYTLEVNESCEPPRVRNLRMELSRDALQAGSLFGVGKFLVLDRTPFLFARVDLPALAQNDGFNSGVVARRVIDTESGQPTWEVALDTSAGDAGAVQVTLPAQATGEEMLLAKKNAAPLPNGGSSTTLFSYRFGAPARLNLAPTYNVQRYAAIPWDLRRLFGYPGQRDPGAEVRKMEFELLYGLTANFSAKDAETTVRVAELFARLGALVGGLPEALPWLGTVEQDAFGLLRAKWRSDSRRFAARLSILQPWSPATATDLVLSKGLQIAPRMQPPPAPNANPQGAQIYFPPDRLDKPVVSAEVQSLFQTDSLKGLAGGFPWGMQEWEAPFYQLFWDHRQSSSAEVRDLGFSSLGGWGQQVARFASNRLLIQARVAMGRTHTYTVERIGKIGVFGHKAKHVIRYDRTVVPSPYSLDFVPKQDAFEGRPVVRKVEEYIELIQDRKDYPDHASGLPLDTGTVRACYFPGKGARIPISGTWGRSWNNGIEWEVPLWRSNADPLLYPKPEIFVEMVSGTGADSRAVAQTISNPEDVYFYTTAQPGLTDDVSAWPQVKGLDYINSEEPTEWSSTSQFPDQDSVPDAGWPEAISTPPGFERFTFHLDPAQDEVNLVANRRDDVMLHGRVRNVTMMRSAPKSKPATAPLQPLAITDVRVADPTVNTSPTVITTATDHGWQTDQLVLIQGRTGATPDINGTWSITRLSPTTFSIPMHVTAAGNPGTGTAVSAQHVAATNVANMRDWQRLVPLGLAETRKLIKSNPAQAAAQLDGTLAALNARLPKIQALPPAPLPQDAFSLTPCTSTKNPLLARAISLGAEAIRQVLTQRGQTVVDDAFRPALDQLKAMAANLNQFIGTNFKVPVHARINEAIGTIHSVIFYVDFAPEQLLEQLNDQLEHTFSAPLDRAQQLVDLCTSKLEELAINAQHYLAQYTAEGIGELDSLKTRTINVWQRADDLLADLLTTIQGVPDADPWTDIKAKCVTSLNAAKATLLRFKDAIVGKLQDARNGFQGAADTGAAAIAQILRETESAIASVAQEPLQEVRASLLLLRQEIRGVLSGNATLNKLRQEVTDWLDTVKGGLGDLDTAISKLSEDIRVDLQTAQNKATQAVNDLKAQVAQLAQNWAQRGQDLFCPLTELDLGLPDVLNDGLQAVEDLGAVADAWNKLKALNFADPNDRQKGLDELDALEHRLGVESSWLGQQVMPVAHDILNAAGNLQYAAQDASDVLRTVRAVCNDLRTDGLGLNRKTVAMILNFRAPTIDLTPTLTRLNQFGQDLGALGLRIPTTELADRFLPNPDWLKTFDLNRIISDCGGARLAGLLQRLKTPPISDKLRVTQGLDKRTLRAWVLAEVDFPLAGQNNLFDFGPIAVVLESATFDAHLRADIDAGGRLTKDAFGQITADWVLATGGQELVAFERTRLTFQNGQMHFDLDPKNIRLGGLLKMISDLTQLLPTPGGDDGPLKVAWLKESVAGFQVPAGVRATLELPSIDAGTTPVAVTGLQLGGFLELRALQKTNKGVEFDFSISVGFHLSRKQKPFNIAIFCLGGGGWVDAGLVYKPLHADLFASITVGIEASVSLSFNLGWLSGGVGISLGLFVEFHHGSQAGTSFSIGLMILLEGNLDLLGIVDVYLIILLQAVYRIADGQKSLDCTGTVDVSIKICWCFTLHVSRSFTYSMGGGGGSSAALAAPAVAPAGPAPDPYDQGAQDYLAMFA